MDGVKYVSDTSSANTSSADTSSVNTTTTSDMAAATGQGSASNQPLTASEKGKQRWLDRFNDRHPTSNVPNDEIMGILRAPTTSNTLNPANHAHYKAIHNAFKKNTQVSYTLLWSYVLRMTGRPPDKGVEKNRAVSSRLWA
ncbi:hypothetical protein LY78DRAFT_681349 [Colletotrichum sublineola]|nr:hypothetical protein LY78DRAFT_681349 [Colletotrichum sublineola]